MASERTILRWTKRLQPLIEYCYNCQARDDGEWIWVLGDQQSMLDFLIGHDVPEELHEQVAESLSCLNCGTELDLAADIGLKTQEEYAWDEMHHEWHKKYATKLDNFAEWITKHPYLAAHHEIGRMFLKQLPDFPKTSTKHTDSWYRARPVWNHGIPTADDMGPPPSPPNCEGRFSHHGQTVLYVADSIKTAAAEALGKTEGVVWVQKMSIGNIDNILDLDSIYSPGDAYNAPILAIGINRSRPHAAEANNSEWKPEYFIPRYIADCARQCGYAGIKYRSTRFYGECLVLFDCTSLSIKLLDKPKLIQWDAKIAERELPF